MLLRSTKVHQTQPEQFLQDLNRPYKLVVDLWVIVCVELGIRPKLSLKRFLEGRAEYGSLFDTISRGTLWSLKIWSLYKLVNIDTRCIILIWIVLRFCQLIDYNPYDIHVTSGSGESVKKSHVMQSHFHFSGDNGYNKPHGL